MLLRIDVITPARFYIHARVGYITITENDYALMPIALSLKIDRVLRSIVKSTDTIRVLPRSAVIIPVKVKNRERLRAVDIDF